MPIPARASAAITLAALTALTALAACSAPGTTGSAGTPGPAGTPAPGGTPGADDTPGAGTPGTDGTPGSVDSGAASPGAQPPEAAPRDGSELAACRDADCEVRVEAGDRFAVDERHGVDRLTVASVGGDGVRIELRGSSGGLSVRGMSISVSSSCDNGRCRDVGALTVRPDTPGRINDMRLRLRALTDDDAILVLSPR